ncbi:hypothetical protein H1P_520026 [Hyella patelloides LEGE 07179]|uniref:Uncharacterized protein n=1 Tax=Hyella patelloides LEGE 07179 TaxID=945734 RepID=A0A563W019_9CYAN|nr:hypothetical protein H1P_520026 [Hyella patelloides LEGE 07179]
MTTFLLSYIVKNIKYMLTYYTPIDVNLGENTYVFSYYDQNS